MNEECPNCRQLTNTSFSRLVKDSCGHTKCRMCLLYEEQGCKACNNEHQLQNIGNYDCPPPKKETSNNSSVCSENNTINDEMVLPLELVINKSHKSKANCFELISVDCVTDKEFYHENVSFNDRTEKYKCSTVNISNDNTSHKLYIPKIEPCDVVLNIRTHLNNNENLIIESQAPCDQRTIEINNTKVETEYLTKEKVTKNKPLKYFDRTHITIIPGNPERYKCNICSKVFQNKKGKCYHDACITGIKPYQCTFCDRSFVKRSHFEYHERVHSGYKPFKCNLCDKAFPQQNKLNRHMHSHNKEKQFVCPKCNKGYTKRDDLKNHLNVHNSTAIYSCKLCDKSFRILTNLKRHMRTHNNERPHICDQCNKSFKDKSLLIRHKRIHGKERPFSCAHCSRVFLSKSELRRHLTVHSDEKPFSCEYCQTVFRRKDNLNRHIRHHHSEDSSVQTAKLRNTVDTGTKSTKCKQLNSKHEQKQKKAQKVSSNSLPKTPTKVSVVYVNSRDQINSRLDSMGNITPVIRTTSEVSNAVPVINGPISIRRPEDKTDTRKKTFTYTEPIPLAEAVVINKRIEEKLYPQSVSNHNYFFRNCLNCTDKSYSTLINQSSRTNSNAKNSTCKMILYENSPLESISSVQTNCMYQNIEQTNDVNGYIVEKEICMKKNIKCENKNDDKNLKNDWTNKCAIKYMTDSKSDASELKKSDFCTSNRKEQANCVPTIKKNITQQLESEILESTCVDNCFETISNTSLPKKIKHSNQKKQSDVHWRRRTAEILKPCN